MPFPAFEQDGPSARDRVDYESSPLTRAEYISALVHLYRGELYRANAWRLRLDNTTNWAVLTSAGLLTFSFGEGAHSHWIVLMGIPIVTVFLFFEARRFRFADVWRSRVRLLEENFYAPILRRDLSSPMERWGDLVADDLFSPRFRITKLQAVRARFARNYWPIYTVLLISWMVHVQLKPLPATSLAEIREHLAGGLLPWWLPLSMVGSCLLGGLWLLLGVERHQLTDLEVWEDPEQGVSDQIGDP
jgi:uncharacterized membrane protein